MSVCICSRVCSFILIPSVGCVWQLEFLRLNLAANRLTVHVSAVHQIYPIFRCDIFVVSFSFAFAFSFLCLAKTNFFFGSTRILRDAKIICRKLCVCKTKFKICPLSTTVVRQTNCVLLLGQTKCRCKHNLFSAIRFHFIISSCPNERRL